MWWFEVNQFGYKNIFSRKVTTKYQKPNTKTILAISLIVDMLFGASEIIILLGF